MEVQHCIAVAECRRREIPKHATKAALEKLQCSVCGKTASRGYYAALPSPAPREFATSRNATDKSVAADSNDNSNSATHG
jgi:hypothetical protein